MNDPFDTQEWTKLPRFARWLAFALWLVLRASYQPGIRHRSHKFLLHLLAEGDAWGFIGGNETLREYLLQLAKADDRRFFEQHPERRRRWRPAMPGEFHPFRPEDDREVHVVRINDHQRLVTPAAIVGRAALHTWIEDDRGPEFDLLGPVYRQRHAEPHYHPVTGLRVGQTLMDIYLECCTQVPSELRRLWVRALTPAARLERANRRQGVR